jgi:hypothetical protein
MKHRAEQAQKRSKVHPEIERTNGARRERIISNPFLCVLALSRLPDYPVLFLFFSFLSPSFFFFSFFFFFPFKRQLTILESREIAIRSQWPSTEIERGTVHCQANAK